MRPALFPLYASANHYCTYSYLIYDSLVRSERERLLRIAQNNALIASLGLQVEDTPSVRSATSKTSKPASKKTTPKRKREDVDDTSVRRRSSRLMGMEAEGEAAVEFQKVSETVSLLDQQRV